MKLETFRTPGGNTARIWCRDGTNDRMTAEIDIEQDRYGIKDWPRGGLIIDIGAHIGTVTVAALLDDPTREAWCVDPLVDNLDMVIKNTGENGVADRRIGNTLAVFGKRAASVPWNFRSKSNPEQAAMHRYIGGFNLDLMPDDVEYDTVKAKAITPASLLRQDVSVLKVAGETAERALVGADLSRVSFIIGKYHSEIPKLIPHLAKTHDVERWPDRDNPSRDGFGWYRGVLR